MAHDANDVDRGADWLGPVNPDPAGPSDGAALGVFASHRCGNGTGYLAGETAQCGVWFPPIEIPVGFGQTRSASELPVLIMVTGYSRWLSALLIPSRHSEDLFDGWWSLIDELGAVPHTFTWHSERAIGWSETVSRGSPPNAASSVIR